MTPPTDGERDGNDVDMKELRRDHPSGWMFLTRYPAVPYMLDAILDAPPDVEFNKSELARRTGLSRTAVTERIDTLVGLGVVDPVPNANRYRVNMENVVVKALHDLNHAVNARKESGPKSPISIDAQARMADDRIDEALARGSEFSFSNGIRREIQSLKTEGVHA